MSALSYAPVALFAFNRADHLRATLNCLAENDGAQQTDLFIFCDGPRSSADEPGIASARETANSKEYVGRFASIKVIEREQNFGLARSIIEGVTAMLTDHERVIVVEDDLVTSKYFLTYMNKGLELYANTQEVMCIHGYAYPIQSDGLPETYFLLGGDCWGWGTWRRGWAKFNPNGTQLLKELRDRNLTSLFDVDNSYAFVQMLEDQIAGKNNSWAIRWRASTFLAGGLTLYPRTSLVKNIGMDGSGTHCGPSDFYEVNLSDRCPTIVKGPLQQNKLAFERLKAYFKPGDPPLRATRAQRLSRFLSAPFKRIGALK